MIRRSRLSLVFANSGKKEELLVFMKEAQRVVRLYIDELWEIQDFKSKFVDFKVDTWLSARMQQALGKQALSIVKSQRKRKRKTKPQFNRLTFELDSRFVDFQEDKNSFDFWIKLSSIGNRISLKLPTKKHRQFNKFSEWEMRKSIKLSYVHDQFFADIYFEKPEPIARENGKSVGIDIGYKKLIVTSDNKRLGDDGIYEKIARKKQGSNAFKKALKERDEYINVACKELMNDNQISSIYAEDLKSVKKNSKGKIRKKFNNKLQRWSYPKVLDKITMLCEEQGVNFKKVDPAYTSQRCSICGVVCKSNRQGETYKCTCGNVMDADYNAACNILHLGTYGAQAFKHFL